MLFSDAIASNRINTIIIIIIIIIDSLTGIYKITVESVESSSIKHILHRFSRTLRPQRGLLQCSKNVTIEYHRVFEGYPDTLPINMADHSWQPPPASLTPIPSKHAPQSLCAVCRCFQCLNASLNWNALKIWEHPDPGSPWRHRPVNMCSVVSRASVWVILGVKLGLAKAWNKHHPREVVYWVYCTGLSQIGLWTVTYYETSRKTQYMVAGFRELSIGSLRFHSVAWTIRCDGLLILLVCWTSKSRECSNKEKKSRTLADPISQYFTSVFMSH